MSCEHEWAGEYPTVHCPTCGISWTGWACTELENLKHDLSAAQERERGMREALTAIAGFSAGEALRIARAALGMSPAPVPSGEPTVTATPEAVARDEALGLRAPPPPPEPAAPLDVEAIRARCDAATKGPWVKCGHGQAGHEDWWSVNRGVDTGRVVEAMPSQVARVLSHSRGAEDAAFIAHARTDVPLLLAEIARLRAAPPAEELTSADWGDLEQIVAAAYAGLRPTVANVVERSERLLPRVRALAEKARR